MTEWIQARPKLAAALAGATVLAVLALVFALSSSGDKPSSKEPSDFGAPLPTLPTRSPVKLPTASPTPSTAAQVQQASQDAFKKYQQGFSSGGFSGGDLSLPGLQGSSIYQYLPKHTLRLQVSSEAPIGTVGYVIPTSLRKPSGIVKKVGTYWTLTTTVYGDPDYAQIFLQAGARGFPITCNITVDGRTSEHRSTEGPYGRMVCQG